MLNNNQFSSHLYQFPDSDKIILASRMRAERIREINLDLNHTIKIEEVKASLRDHIEFLQGWLPHYDFGFWDKIEIQFDRVWPSLSNSIYLGVEYSLYEEVRDVFFEIRNLLQWTGKIEDRIYLSAWLKRESEERNDKGTTYLAISSLVWSYTSSGCYQDLQQASILWQSLKNSLMYIDKISEIEKRENQFIKTLGKDIYSELMMDIHENGVRIAIRNRNLDEANKNISKGIKMIDYLYSEELISQRLKERFETSFQYHKGIIYFLNQNFSEAQYIFNNILFRANSIGWDRVVKGAQSWLATIAMELKNYAECEALLADLAIEFPNVPSKRDGICHLIKAQLSGRKGQNDEKIASEERAIKVFERFSAPFSHNNANFSIDSFALLSISCS